MSEVQKHKIQKASLQIDFEGLEHGLGLQDNLSLYFYEKIEPILQKLFDEHSSNDLTIKIDKLDLDCGPLGSHNWEHLLLDKLKEQAILALKPHQEKQESQISHSEIAEEVFFFYLAKGYFPWNSPFSNLLELEQKIEINERLISRFHLDSLLLEKPVRRLTLSFSTAFLHKLTAHFLQIEKEWIKEVFVKGLEKQDSLSNIIKDLTACILLSVSPQKTVDQKNLWNKLISNIPENQEMLEFVLSGILKETAMQKSFESFFTDGDLKPVALKRLKDFIKTALYQKPELNKKDWFNSLVVITETINYPLDKTKGETVFQKKSISDTDQYSKKPVQKQKSGPSEPELGEFIYVENGGMVVLHPFFMPLFENLGLVKEGYFHTSEMQNQAISILEFLVWGENKHSENYFPLNKILCGLHPQELWESGVGLNQTTKDACEEMLQEAINHWKALKNTGIEGFRETFLQRNGKLSRSNNGWKLTIEQKTVDVLLSNLPWGMGIIKLPWMENMLFVEWN